MTSRMILIAALAASDVDPADRDVLVVTQKIVSKAERRQSRRARRRDR